MLLISFSLAALFLATGSAVENSVNVDIQLGSIKGLQMESRLGVKFWSFRGIRYAEPPIGELRFQNPRPVREWKPKVFDATRDGPVCPQLMVNQSLLSEDCLRLNVYSRNLNATKGLKPVIVYLHPGGFYAGSAFSPYAGAQHFMDRDIVLVTVNYRLGALGYLSTGTADIPGNMGLKDQVIALRWVQKNIEKFGGDPKSVTLMGYSAGSVSIGLHMMSPMSKGLFHRGIMQSASPLGQFRYRSNLTDLVEKQARLLNCPVKPTKDMVKCLQSKPMTAFLNTTTAIQEEGNWVLVVERTDYGQERFIVEDPYKTMISGNIYKVPLIMGINQNEFYYLGYYTLRNKTLLQQFNRDFDKYSPIYFLYERNTPKSRNISQALRSFYFKDKPLEFPQSVKAFGELYSDSLICFEYYRFLQMVSKHVPVHTYFFTYKGRFSYFRDPETNQTLGAMHHDELLYLFNIPSLAPMISKTDPENNTIERLTRMWFEFAKNGDPNNKTDEYLKNLAWPLYDDKKKQYLEINNELAIKPNGIFPERLQFWDRLFPIQDMLSAKV